MAGKHARLSASDAERWFNCPGAINASPKDGAASFEAAQGTVAHGVASDCLTKLGSMSDPNAYLGRVIGEEGHKITVDAEMVAGVQFYLDDVARDWQPGDQVFIEVKLTEALSKLHPDLGGTADFARYRPATRHLLVKDFKYGAGVLVLPADNKQLKTYALGVVLALGVAPAEITISINQPRIEHPEGRVRDWTFSGFEIAEFGAAIVAAAKATRDPNAPLNPGPWCKKSFCPAAATCPALEAYRQELMKADLPSFAGGTDVVAYDKPALLKALAMIEPLKAKIKALEELAYREANAGRITAADGWKLVAKRPSRIVVDEVGVLGWAKARGIDPYAPRELKSPAQLEKGTKKADKAELARFVESRSSGTTLVPVADERPEHTLISADDYAALPAPAQLESKPGANLFD